ncbi:MAG: Eco57I restriction-modification methylase domain-containing protein [Acidobacteriia bacterium]|nr:Eco57I restriction-modification methylase domain-containing protein [Terriglobia bacterium]
MTTQPFDVDISLRDIQSVSDADALASFLSKLGYDTSRRTVQTPANLSLSESVANPITRVELIAGEPNRLQVYLFELKSVTVAEIRALARAFRTFSGRFLLVLTVDYDHLDFVLLDPEVPAATNGSGLGTPQVSLNPRRFNLERRKPTAVDLRVLRRFTWTEPTAFDQFEKLRYAYDLAHWSEVYFNNRGLFSDYYLTERLRPRDAGLAEFSEWLEDPKPAYQRLRALYEQASTRFAGKRIADLCNVLYEPLLKELGFSVTRAQNSESGLYFRLTEPPSGSSAQPKKLLAICLPYPWGRELDRKDDTRDAETPEVTPTFSAVDLLAQQNAPWVILTNGKLWRLYSQRAHSRATNYYEVDADEVLGRYGFQQDIQDAFRYFWLLFRMQAFQLRVHDRDGRKAELSMLDRLQLGSEDYAKQLGDSLKNRVFLDVFPELAEGFIAHRREREGRDVEISEDDRTRIFQGTLTLLYRLLFLLYAESRDLLPLRASPEYFQTSLTRLKQEIGEAAGRIDDETEVTTKASYRDDQYGLWQRLRRLFHVIDEGSEDLNVPRYNGGLFQARPEHDDGSPEAEANRFLERERVADQYLARAVDLLARGIDPKRHDLVMIDYKSLGVRQLGSIYEGLLEFRLCIAEQKLAIVKEKGREVYKAFRDLEERDRERAERQGSFVRKGKAYLENDKRERKATGSYYTPDHIVKYIVEHAIGPVLKEKFEALRPKLREAQQERREFFRQQEEFLRRRMRPKPAEQAGLIGRELVDDLFNIKVLDPAMGSGHFLVEAVDFVTDETIKFLSAFPWNPVQEHLNAMRGTIRRQMSEQGIEIDYKRLDDTNLLKRHVLKRSIYGVDLNSMAVELAKVSLWLDCFTLGAPLSFLDHHLRLGNSLIGSTLEEVDKIRKEKGQLPLTQSSDWAGLTQAVQAMVDVGGMPDITADQVGESKQHYKSALMGLEAFKKVLDLHTARWFVEAEETSGKHRRSSSIFDDMLRSGELFEWAHGRVTTPLERTAEAGVARKLVKEAAAAAKDRRLFHWELEFPEVFYGRRPGTQNAVERLGGAGFDAVVGNPPYDVLATEELGYDVSDEIGFFEEHSPYAPSLGGKQNLYKLFVCRALAATKQTGRFSFIVPMPLLGDEQAVGVRRALLEMASLSHIEAFPQKDDASNRVFPEAKLSTTVFVAQQTPSSQPFRVRTHEGRYIEETSTSLLVDPPSILAFDPGNLAIPSCSQRDWELAVRILKNQTMQFLKQIAVSHQGEVNEVVERGKGNLSSDMRAPVVLRGANICLYAVREASQGEEVRLSLRRFLSNKSPTSKAFAHKWERVGFQRKSPQNNFRRLIAARIPKGQFCMESISYIAENECTVALETVLALLNSKLLEWYFRLGSTNAQINEYQLSALPTPTIKDQPDVDWGPQIRARHWSMLREELEAACTEPAVLPSHVGRALGDLVRAIEHIEAHRAMTGRSARSGLAPEAQEIQDVIDSVLFHVYGLSPDDARYVESRLKEML